MEKSVGVFEILLMVCSIISFSFIIGEEIGVVSAFTSAGSYDKLIEIRPNQILTGGPTKIKASEVAKAFVKNSWEATQGIAVNAVVAYSLYAGTKWVASLFGKEERFGEELGSSVGWGYFAFSSVSTLLTSFGVQGTLLTPLGPSLIGGIIGITPLGLIGIGVGVIYFLGTYKDVKYYQVEYNCYGWQPITKGEKCDECNKGQFPCTKLRCESLGQGCEIVNEGTTEEQCFWNDRNNIAPPEITAWNEPLDKGLFKYTPDTATLPGDKGVVIKYIGPNADANGCIPPFTVLDYGITLDKPGQCRVDTNRTRDYESMEKLISNGNYVKNHTIRSVHAGATELKVEDLDLENGGNYEIFVRCESKNGNSNDGTFVFKYCVNNEPDITAPIISETTPLNGFPIQQGLTSIDIEVYTDKPSDCKWSHADESYDIMANTMSCAQSITEMNANMLYKCTTQLTGLKDSVENKFYFNCESYPLKEGTNKESERRHLTKNYPYTLIGTKAIVIDSIKPNDTVIRDSTPNVPVTIEVKTSAGYDKGNSWCYLKPTESTANYILFASDIELTYQHTQELWLTAGNYDYDIKCCDLGGNCDIEKIEFDVETDFDAPKIVRVYNEGDSLKLITNEKAECVYDTTNCNYEFENGVMISNSDNIEHTTEWDTENTFYVKCKDEFDGQPSANECTIIVRPSNNF